MQLGFDYVALKETLPDTSRLFDQPHVVGIEREGKLLDTVGTQTLLAIDEGEEAETHSLKYAGRADFQVVNESELRKVMDQSLMLAQFDEQKRFIRNALKTNFGLKQLPSDHFLLRDLTSGWWSRSLPSAFGVYLQLHEPESDLLILFRKGQVTECRSPDFTSLARERQDDLNARAAFLTSRYGVKIQAISLSERDWMRISGEEKPWKPFAELLRKGQIAMHPFKWRMTFSMSLRAFFGI